MAGKIRVELVTPKGIVIDKEVDEVIAPGGEGEFGVLIGHIPMLTFIKPGVLSYLENDNFFRFAVGSGFCEVLKDRVTVLVDDAYTVEQIDPVEAANEATQLEEILLDMDPWSSSREYRDILDKYKLARAKVALTTHQ
jgi:F-type H+-transporting ATPase subunit epsilon